MLSIGVCIVIICTVNSTALVDASSTDVKAELRVAYTISLRMNRCAVAVMHIQSAKYVSRENRRREGYSVHER